MYKVLLTIICFISIPLSCQTENNSVHNLCTTTINIKNSEVIEVESNFQLNEPVKDSLLFVVNNDIFDIMINGKTDYNYVIDSSSGEKKINLDIAKYDVKNIKFTYKILLENLMHKTSSGILLMDKEFVPQIYDDKRIHYFDYNIIPQNIYPYKYYITNSNITDRFLTDRIIIILSNSKYSKFSKNNISVFSTQVAEDKINSIVNESKKIRDIYNNYLQINKLKDINILINDYYNYSFYSRDNFISLQNIPYLKGNVYLLSHEIAHSWFNNAEIYNYSSDAFINESLAEYMSYIYYRTVYGEALFQKLIEKKKKESNEVTYSLMDVSKNMEGEIREKILYTKGAVICYEIEKKIGRNNFKHLLQMVIKNRISSISGFEEMLRKNYSESAESLFKNLKNSKSFSL